jgi:hypothetical protein
VHAISIDHSFAIGWSAAALLGCIGINKDFMIFLNAQRCKQRAVNCQADELTIDRLIIPAWDEH